MADKPPDAFLSYTRFDDQHDRGAISRFHASLESAIRAVAGEPFQIFQDVDDIGVGERWSNKLASTLDQVPFFIPILTPSYFRSPACRDELTKFLEAEKRARRDDLILPIYYIECSVLEDKALRERDELATVISGRQRWEWRKLRHYSFKNRKVRLTIEALAREIVAARRRATPTAAPSGPVTFRDIDEAWCPEMVEVPAGEFMMGSTEAERQWAVSQGARQEWVEREKPQHQVWLARPLAIGRYPVTFEEFDHFAAATGREPPDDRTWGRGRRPVINVSWEDAKAYTEWLAREANQSYRLLSEAEWEYACRAGTMTRYSWGDEITPENANFGRKDGRTSEVGAYPANRWGLHDMHGNVWEWVEDAWHGGYDSAPDDGAPWLQGKDSRRVVRGGAWNRFPGILRAACRYRLEPGLRDYGLGLRVARTLTGLPLRPQHDLTNVPESFEEAVKLFESRGEPMLHGWLYQAARLVHYEPGRIELQMGAGTPAGLSGRVAAALGRWTGRPWLISIGRDSKDAQETLASQAARKHDDFSS